MALVLGVLALMVSLAALWLASDIHRTIAKKNLKLVGSHITPLSEAIKTDRAENQKLRQQVITDRDIIEALDSKVKLLEDTVQKNQTDIVMVKKTLQSNLKPTKQSKKTAPANRGSLTGTNG